MDMKKLLAISLVTISLSGCLDISKPFVIDFSRSDQGFEAIFSDYPVSDDFQNNEEFFELDSGHEPLPSPFQDESGWMLSGINRSDDLKMAIKGYRTGLLPNTAYDFKMSAEITTDIQSFCVGIGGAPGESVYFKLGASKREPINRIEEPDAFPAYIVSIDVGNQAQSGSQGGVAGNVANGITCGEENAVVKKTVTMESTVRVYTDFFGGFWIYAGTDSGFEGKTTYHINSITTNISRASLSPKPAR
ncbi:hypothetical protein [Veronia pacifica]|uniref:Lipoprotein n=1 Tax=Veronia pacifica TaxID=1080227 RepID=A0A1C3E9J5_9GAMM|nr:hypothetical protein [Veronia pacifica]ODA29894.1 hypothetical protein A8L45_21275 [Veronia pacifica]